MDFAVWITCETEKEGRSVINAISKKYESAKALGNCLHSLEANERGCRLSLEISGDYYDRCGGASTLRNEISKLLKDQDWIFIVVAGATGGSSWSLNNNPKRKPRNKLESLAAKKEEKTEPESEQLIKPDLNKDQPAKPDLKRELLENRLPLNTVTSIIKSSVKLSDTFFDVNKLDRQRLLDKLEKMEEDENAQKE